MTVHSPEGRRRDSKQGASPNDGAVMGLLLLLIVVAWSGAYSKWSLSAWAVPIRYLDPVYADFIGASAAFKTMAHESLWPLSERVASNLGAPTPRGVNSTASPTTNEIETTLAGILTWAWGLFAGINATFLIGHLATAASFYVVARMMAAAPSWSFVGGLAYGLAPYLFAQTPHHITCQFIFYVPLYVLVWHWLSTSPGLTIGSRRFWAAAAIAFLSGMENPYFTNILCQLALLGGAALAWQTRSWEPFAAAAAVVGAAAIGFGFINIETLIYRISNPALGENVGAILHREYRWMDIYGLKLIDLFIPSVSHHSAFLAKFGLTHRQASVLNDEEGCAYLGIFGAASLIWMTGFSVKAVVERRYSDVPIATWQVLWVVLMFTTGGMNAIIAAFTGFTLFRTACRYSVIILLIALIWAVTRLTNWQQRAERTWPKDSMRIAVATLVIGLTALVWWDQVPRVASAEQRQLIYQQVQSDKQFAEAMEQSLPAGAMVLQLPVMDASGSPIPGVPPYDHYRPYLYSKDLKISFGATPGDAASTWQHAAQRQLTTGAEIDQEKQILRFNPRHVAEALMQIQKAGFAALYVNRNGFPDGGKGLEATLRELGYTKPPIESTLGDLVCFVLEKE